MTADQLPFVMALIAMASVILGLVTLNRGARNRDQDSINAAQAKLDTAVRSLDEKLTERIEARSAIQDKARHDLAASCAAQLAEQRRDLADLRAKAVTREDMVQLKAEMKADFARLESKIDRLIESRATGRRTAAE
jgi:hypothetical protein